jgi:hypothetical protein
VPQFPFSEVGLHRPELTDLCEEKIKKSKMMWKNNLHYAKKDAVIIRGCKLNTRLLIF